MKPVISDPPTTVKANPRSGGPVFWLSLVLAALGVGILAVPKSARAEVDSVASVNILVYNYAEVSPLVLAGAEREAGRILAQGGARAVWVDCSDKNPTTDSASICKSGWGTQNLALRLLPRNASNKFQDFTFGFAVIPGLASVYYGDAALLADRDEIRPQLPIILGCLIAHEIGHLLLSSKSHSTTGIMQAQWERKQIRQSLTGVMLFTPQQSKLIREEVQRRMSSGNDSLLSEASSRQIVTYFAQSNNPSASSGSRIASTPHPFSRAVIYSRISEWAESDR